MTTKLEGDDTDELTDAQRRAALALAERAIEYGLEHSEPMPVGGEIAAVFPEAERASFVTLHLDDDLVGCIGRLEPTRPLPADLVRNAFRAAFRDPRFPPVTADDLEDLSVQVSVLDPLERVPADSNEKLWEFVEPGRHGVLLTTEETRGTFLPSVWEKCPDPETFLAHLKHKAGLDPSNWPADLDVYRYTVDEFDRESLS